MAKVLLKEEAGFEYNIKKNDKKEKENKNSKEDK